ncbi:MAG: 3'-5' exonuclease [Gammaproteobacteria bacterium]|nr:3'-5' exonuclease [Gammaproteobacteria bacterium]
MFSHRFHPLTRLDKTRREYLIRKELPSFIRSLLANAYPKIDQQLDTLDVLSIDFETTGMDASRDHILSMGYVTITSGVIQLNTATHHYLNGNTSVSPDTAVINHIVPEMLTTGISPEAAFNALFHAMHNKILLAHGSIMEKRFTEQYLLKTFGLKGLPLLWIDTLSLEQYRTNSRNPVRDYRLSSIRKRYQLPDYNAHNALTDAISTAELYLAQLKSIFGNEPATLGHLYKCSQQTSGIFNIRSPY